MRTIYGFSSVILGMLLEAVTDGSASGTPAVTTAPVEEKLSIAQKVAALEAEKAGLVANLASMTMDSPEKSAAQERIAVIDRKVRWYAGRNGAAKTAKTSKTSPSKDQGRGKKAKATPQAAPAVQPAAGSDPNAS